jgi:dTDP-4-amino-4,6-dideoxygalactose transaminase
VHFIPLHLHPYWKDSGDLQTHDYPIAQQLFEQEVSLPLYTRMTPDDVTRVIAAVREVLQDA